MPEFVASTTDLIIESFVTSLGTLIAFVLSEYLLVLIGMGLIAMIWGYFRGWFHAFKNPV